MYWRPELLVALAFFALVTVGLVFASNRGVALHYYKSVYWKIILMMLAIAWLTREHKDFSKYSISIVLFGMLVGITALYNKFNGIGMVEETRVTIGRHLGSVLGDPNDLALVLMFPFAFAVGLALTKSLASSHRLVGIIGTPIFFFAVLATQSRGGLLGVLSILAVFGYRKIKSKVLLASLAAITAIILFAVAGIADRKSGGAAEEGLDASAQGRLYAWEAAAKMAVENPLTGVGIDNFYSNYYYYSSHWDGLNHAVHSTWFGVLAETGFIGLLVFITLIICLLVSTKCSLETIINYQYWRNAKEQAIMTATSESLLAGLIATIVSGTFLTQGFTWPIYIFAGLVVALAQWTQANCTNKA
ncbi:O-antigen ligase family protein [Agaribacterium sp. ZY112]|uniref:O-antigen ligase family protein n=1 Tax=Agaribacterium sp. ZY112 TaxID=3233574 RepID=UPI003523674D